MTVGTVGGVRLKVHPLFLLLLLTAAAGGQVLPALVVTTILLSHELAHLAMARAWDLRVSEIEFLPFGGVARIEEMGESDAAVEAVVAAAGPLNNLLLLAAGIWLQQRGLLDPAVARLFIDGNLALAAFNLLPVLPLDGGRFLRAVLSYRLGQGRATRLLARAGQAAAAAMMAAGLAALCWERFIPNAFLLAGFLYVAAGRELASGGWEAMRVLWRKRQRLRQRGILPVRELVATRATPLREVARHLVAQRYHVIWVTDEEMNLLGLVEEPALLEGLARKGARATLGDLLPRRAPS